VSVETILVGIDGSEGSERAVRWTAELAASLGARVVAVHVYEPLAHLGDTESLDFREMEDATEKRLRQEWVKPLVDGGVEIDASIHHGVPAEVLLDVAGQREVDLMVVGARGLGHLRSLALGSTSSKLIQSAPCPVTVIPPSDRRR
jgi:nucleotide-binding universal stress UspA family protein